MPKVSVIVAVYNAEQYLLRCLESLQKQTLDDFEVVLVDDGAKDKSGLICDEFASKNSRFRVVHKENGGVSSARQCGIDNALGDFVIHVDPDDWVETTMLEELYSCAQRENSDLVICDYYTHLRDGMQFVSQKPQSLEPELIYKELFSNLHGSCWNKLVRMSCIRKFRVNFPENLIVWEDLLFSLNLVSNKISISYLPKAFYHYDRTTNDNCVTRVASRRKLDSMLFFIDYFEKKIPKSAESLLDKQKIEMKRTAFLIKGMSKSEFKNICSDVNQLFCRGFDDFKKIDKLIRFALTRSWIVARFACKLWLWRQTRRCK